MDDKGSEPSKEGEEPIAAVPSPSPTDDVDDSKWVVLRSDQRVVLYDPDNMSLTVQRGRHSRKHLHALPASDDENADLLAASTSGPRGRVRRSRPPSHTDSQSNEDRNEDHHHHDDYEEDEVMPDRENSLVRAHPPAASGRGGRCALCNQLLPDASSSTAREDLGARSQFIHNQYFRLLASSASGEVPSEPEPPGRRASRSRKSSRGPGHNGNDPEHLSSKSFNDGYYERFFVEVSKLGRGFRGSVFLCQHLLDGIALSEYAVKKIPVGESHSWLVRMLREVRLLERLQHQNVIDYKHAWLEHHSPTLFGPPVPTLFVLMNLANGGNLEDYICVQQDPLETAATANLTAKELRRLRQQANNASSVHKIGFSGSWQAGSSSSPQSSSLGLTTTEAPRNPAQFRGGIGWAVNSDGTFQVPARKVRYLTEDQIWSMFLDVTRGLHHLHRHRIVHRDLKPPNLLLQYVDPAQKHLELCPRVLISDFGECEILSEQEQNRRRSGATGTLEFTAPELLSGDGDGSLEEGIHADLWALGMILYFLCFSRLPWSQIEDVDLLKAEIVETARNLTIPDDDTDEAEQSTDRGSPRVPKDLRTLIRLLLNPEGSKRPSAQWILDIYDGVRANGGMWGRPPRRSEDGKNGS